MYAGGHGRGRQERPDLPRDERREGSAYVEPDCLIVNPADWQEIRLLTDDQGGYMGGGPFGSQYGGVSVGVDGQVSGDIDVLWNKPVHVTSALGAGTALVGTRAGAAVYRRGLLTVEMTNSHADLFTSDMVAIRAERRAALCVPRAGPSRPNRGQPHPHARRHAENREQGKGGPRQPHPPGKTAGRLSAKEIGRFAVMFRGSR